MPYNTPPWTQIIAHRGNSGPMPENTLVAINSAIAIGVDMVEVDVRLTSDGVPVLMHHDRVDFTTSGTGLVSELTWDELATLDAGSWLADEFSGEPIRSLEQVLASTAGRIALNLDIKVPEAAEPTAVAASRAGVSESVVISGCTEDEVRRIGDLEIGISVLLNLDELLFGIDPSEARAVAMHSIELAHKLGAIAINVPHTLIDVEIVAHARDAGVGVWAFTVDDEKRFGELIDDGVNSITTNWPGRMLHLVQRAAPERAINHR